MRRNVSQYQYFGAALPGAGCVFVWDSGDQDCVIPVTAVQAFESSLSELGITNETHVYPGVGHAFANPSRVKYAPEETRDTWQKTLSFLERNLK